MSPAPCKKAAGKREVSGLNLLHAVGFKVVQFSKTRVMVMVRIIVRFRIRVMVMVMVMVRVRVIMRSHAGLLIRHCEAQQGFTDHPVVAES